jgi:hypothetical protein
VKILFLLGATSRIRNFHETLTILAERGHEIRLTGRMRKGTFDLPPSVSHERISGRLNPTQRVDQWRDFVDLLRGARDYVRYFDPRFARATRLIARAYEIAPTEFVLFCERHPWVKRRWKLAGRALAWCESLVPSDSGFEEFLHEERPDLVLVTPLVTFEAYQTDYVKAAHRLGIPVAFIPFSWDNLTNKGLMRVHPDRVFVWNEVQRREAIELHGCRPDSVVVTGAARFDEFFARTPATTRDEFFGRFGLDPARPMIVYLGSAQLTGPNEMELVRLWIESLRAAGDAHLRACGILVRPHPAVRVSWASVDLSHLGHVAISLDASPAGDQELFDSVYHAHAAVGLNTSAMLEAAIVGRPVHTLLIPGFDQGQVGTIHFQYLVESYGGVATVARDFEEHHRQLTSLLREAPASSAKSRAFAARFLRPRGVDQAVSPILAAEIERAAAVVKRPLRTSPLQAPFRRALLAWLGHRTASVNRHASADTSVIGTWQSLHPVRTALTKVQDDTIPVLIGPWNDAMGIELLYWIPFIRWASVTYALAPERLIVLSGTGLREWYGPIAHRFLGIRSLFSDPELEHWASRTVPQREQNPKQTVMSPFDREIIERAARAFDLSEYHVLHPFLLFRLLHRLTRDLALDRLREVMRHEVVDASFRSQGDGLPESFVAVSTEFTAALPRTEDNERLLAAVVAQIGARSEVVRLDGLPLGRQTEVLARARAFLGGYGDLAILAAFCGTPSTVYHSKRLPADFVDRLQAAATLGGWAPVMIERARRFKGVRLPETVRA